MLVIVRFIAPLPADPSIAVPIAVLIADVPPIAESLLALQRRPADASATQRPARASAT